MKLYMIFDAYGNALKSGDVSRSSYHRPHYYCYDDLVNAKRGLTYINKHHRNTDEPPYVLLEINPENAEVVDE